MNGTIHFFHFNCVFHLFQGVGTFKSFFSFISIVFFICFRVRDLQIFHFFHFNCVFHLFQGAGTLKTFISFILIVFFICFRVQGPSNLSFLSFLSFQLCFSFVSGCWDPQIIHFFHFNCVFHLFQVAGTFKSFISFILIVFFICFRLRGPSNLLFLSFQLCFSFVSGCCDPQIIHFFHFNCVFHLFQGAGTFKSFISFISIVFFICFRLRDPQIFHFFHFNCVFHFFEAAGTLKSFISFISIVFFICFRVLGPSNHSFLSF